MPAFAKRPIAEITPLDVRTLVKAVKDRSEAARTLAVEVLAFVVPASEAAARASHRPSECSSAFSRNWCQNLDGRLRLPGSAVPDRATRHQRVSLLFDIAWL
jgi:hypothetical protein